jgi:hypothetical protein
MELSVPQWDEIFMKLTNLLIKFTRMAEINSHLPSAASFPRVMPVCEPWSVTCAGTALRQTGNDTSINFSFSGGNGYCASP